MHLSHCSTTAVHHNNGDEWRWRSQCHGNTKPSVRSGGPVGDTRKRGWNNGETSVKHTLGRKDDEQQILYAVRTEWGAAIWLNGRVVSYITYITYIALLYFNRTWI